MRRALAWVGGLMRRAKAPPVVPMSGWSAPLTTIAAAAMSFLAVLTVAAGLAAGALAAEWRRDLAGLATLRVIAPPEEIDARLARALEVVRATRGIGAARVVGEAEQLALLGPWLGDMAGLATLPMPRLVDLTLEGDGPDAARLQARLDRDAPGARYDDHAAWRRPLAGAAASLGALAWVATAVVTLAAGATVALAARATLSANLEIVRLIRLIGGEDQFIRRAFIRRLATRGALGGLVGTGAGLALLELLPNFATGAGGGGAGVLAAGFGIGTSAQLVLVSAIPLAAGAVAYLAARVAVRLALMRMM